MIQPPPRQSAPLAPSRSAIIGDQCVPNRKSIKEISEKKRTASYSKEKHDTNRGHNSDGGSKENDRRRKASNATRALNRGVKRGNAISKPTSITNKESANAQCRRFRGRRPKIAPRPPWRHQVPRLPRWRYCSIVPISAPENCPANGENGNKPSFSAARINSGSAAIPRPAPK